MHLKAIKYVRPFGAPFILHIIFWQLTLNFKKRTGKMHDNATTQKYATYK